MSAKKQQAELAAKAAAMCEDVFNKEVISDEEWDGDPDTLRTGRGVKQEVLTQCRTGCGTYS